MTRKLWMPVFKFIRKAGLNYDRKHGFRTIPPGMVFFRYQLRVSKWIILKPKYRFLFQKNDIVFLAKYSLIFTTRFI